MDIIDEQHFDPDYNPADEKVTFTLPETQEDWNDQKQDLVEMDAELDHAKDVMLSYKGLVVDKKLDALRKEMISQDHSLVIGEWYDKLETMKASKLYDALYRLPKPAVHHVHLTACASMDYLIYLTYYDYVFYSNKENMFYVSRNGCDKPGYVKVTSLRQYWKNSNEFDEWLKEKILLKPPKNVREDHMIWQGFQHKFSLTFQLYNYVEFFEKILYRVSKDMINELCTVVEYRHIFGCLHDDDQNTVPLKKELAIFKKVQDLLQKSYPLF